jgi:DNA-binding transcriptional regulator LsrR (DeoR family)/transcriptional regulator with XRE-family HTH domain
MKINTSLNKDFGLRLKELMKTQDINVKELARILGHSPQHVSNMRTGNKLPTVETLCKLCDFFNTTPDRFLGFTSKMTTSSAIDKDEFGQKTDWLKWAVCLPPDEEKAKDIERGVQLFISIVTERIQAREAYNKLPMGLRNSGEIDFEKDLRLAFLSGKLQLLDIKEDEVRQQKLKDKYGLKNCYVAKLDALPTDNQGVIDSVIRTEAIAYLCAKNVQTILAGAKKVGLVGGGIMGRFVDLVTPGSLSNKVFFSLLKEKTNQYPDGATANGVVSRMVQTQTATGYLMPFIDSARRLETYFSDNEIEQEELSGSRFTRDEAALVDVAFMSVGSTSTSIKTNRGGEATTDLRKIYRKLSPSQKEACRGDILRFLVDGMGNRVGSDALIKENDALIYSITFDELRAITANANKSVWIVAGRKSKSEVIRGAITSGLANCLVVENLIADELINN